MKINKAISLCKKSGIICILDSSSGLQWLSNKEAAYPLFNMPAFTPELLCYAHDISEKQQEKIVFEHEELTTEYDFKDCIVDEEQAEEYGFVIRTNSRTVLPLKTSNGLFFIDETLLSPLSDTPDLFFWLRKSASGQPYFAVKRGFEVIAIVLPVFVVTEGFVNSITQFNSDCINILSRELK